MIYLNSFEVSNLFAVHSNKSYKKLKHRPNFDWNFWLLRIQMRPKSMLILDIISFSDHIFKYHLMAKIKSTLISVLNWAMKKFVKGFSVNKCCKHVEKLSFLNFFPDILILFLFLFQIKFLRIICLPTFIHISMF